MKAECRNYKLESQQLCPGLQGRFSQPSSMSALIMDWNNAFHCRPALWLPKRGVPHHPPPPPHTYTESISYKDKTAFICTKLDAFTFLNCYFLLLPNRKSDQIFKRVKKKALIWRRRSEESLQCFLTCNDSSRSILTANTQWKREEFFTGFVQLACMYISPTDFWFWKGPACYDLLCHKSYPNNINIGLRQFPLAKAFIFSTKKIPTRE